MLALVWAAWAALGPAANPLTLDDIWRRARPGASALQVEAELASMRQALAETSRLAGGPTLGLGAGPRRTDGATRGDLALDLDLPLLARPAARGELQAALARAETLLAQTAEVEERRRIAAAAIAVWLAGERAAGHREDLATVERWREIAARRAEGGAEAPFELDLVDLELGEARSALAAAEGEVRRAWAELAALADLPAEPRAVAEPPLPPLPEPATVPGRVRAGALSKAIEARRELAELAGRLELVRAQSRLSLRSSLAQEGLDRVARLGLAYRLPLGGETSAAEAALDRRLTAERRQAELAVADLEARTAAAAAQLAAAATAPAVGIARPLAALELRLVEGKSRPSETLTLRRSLLAAQRARLDRRAAALAAAYEIAALTAEVAP